MPNWFRPLLKILFLGVGLFGIFVIVNGILGSVNDSIQRDRDDTAGANIILSSISATPFGPQIESTHPGDQIFYNITIKRVDGKPCFVHISWRWILHLPSGNNVMWNVDNGQFFAGDQNENLAQTVEVPTRLIPGNYTLSRLSVFKCGNVAEYAKTVRNADLKVL